MQAKVTRRQALGTGAAATAAIAFPSVVRGSKPYDGQTLSVFTYAGAYEATIKNHLIKSFEERTGARIKLDAGWWDMLPKLKASPPGNPVYDIVLTDPTQGFPSIKEGLFQKLDLANVPNAKKIPQSMQDNWIQKDGWGINMAGSAMVMGFNTELVKEVPKHWHDLLRADLKGKLSMYDAPYQSLYAYAQIMAGQAGRPGTGVAELKKSVDDVLKFSKEHRDIVRLWWTSTGDFMGKLLQKEISGGVIHSTGPFGAESEGKPVKSVVPPEGTAMVHIFWSITNGTKRKRLAEEFANDILADDFQVKWGTEGKLAVPNITAAGRAANENPFYKKFLPTSAADWSKIEFYPYDIYFEGDNWKKINDVWTREVLRKA